VSCGVVGGEAVIDLDYSEDSTAETDANFVMTGSGGLVEVQGTAEGAPFSEAQLLSLLALARNGVVQLIAIGWGASSLPGWRPSSRARASARGNQRASSSSTPSTWSSRVVACAMQPIISDAGNGQGCEAR